ncbi:MAG: HTH domain-containing protein [Defluviitaleaceae bacterium]|nr:HTH domain-containing protein [Defluviitaleaceae bacterium]
MARGNDTIALVMNMQIVRLLEIVYILLHRKIVPARVLAEQLGVSRRTIYRDIETLGMAGIPIYTEKGKGGGVSLLPNSVLNKSVLSEQEQNEILDALHGLSKMNVSETDKVLKKLSMMFNKTATKWLAVDFSDWSNANDYFNQFKTAILEKYVAEFDYYNKLQPKDFSPCRAGSALV